MIDTSIYERFKRITYNILSNMFAVAGIGVNYSQEESLKAEIYYIKDYSLKIDLFPFLAQNLEYNEEADLKLQQIGWKTQNDLFKFFEDEENVRPEMFDTSISNSLLNFDITFICAPFEDRTLVILYINGTKNAHVFNALDIEYFYDAYSSIKLHCANCNCSVDSYNACDLDLDFTSKKAVIEDLFYWKNDEIYGVLCPKCGSMLKDIKNNNKKAINYKEKAKFVAKFWAESLDDFISFFSIYIKKIPSKKDMTFLGKILKGDTIVKQRKNV